ncbi:MAG: hypothetical protein H7Z41_04995 [Cytophagales bacterium]|nr:hypothetical protein [Armatimonadota bacterium]
MRRRTVSLSVRAAATTVLLAAGTATTGAAQVPVVAAAVSGPTVYPVRALIKRRLAAPAPMGADALRLSVLSDGSGAKIQIRLLSPGSSAVSGVDSYYAAPPISLDSKGWKTVTLPLAQFAFHSEQSPETDTANPVGSLILALPTIDTLQVSAVAMPTCKVFLDDIAWVSTAGGPADATHAVIDDFETPVRATSPAAWRLTGDHEQLRAAQAGQNRVAAFVKSGQGSLQFVVRCASRDEKQLYGPALLARLKRQSAQPYVVYVRPPFQSIRPDSTPSVKELGALPRLDLTACAGETEPVTFSVFSATDLRNATVKVTGPFVSESKQSQIPAAAISVHVVRLGDGSPAATSADSADSTDASAPVPEVLMKDDRESLMVAGGGPPAVRLAGDPSTDVPAGTSKQFWVTVRVPKNQVGSIYSGSLVFSAPGVKPTALPMRINVLPMQLRTAFLQYGIDLRCRLSPEGAGPGDLVVTPETYAAELTNVRDHGFKIVTIDEPLSTLGQALSLYKQVGLSASGPVVVTAPLRTQEEFQQVEALREGVGLSPEFEIYYRMPSDLLTETLATPAEATAAGTDAPLTPLGAYARAIRKASRSRALVVAPIPSRAMFNALSPVMDNSLFAPIFAATSDYTTSLVATGKREIGNRDYWSWNMALQNPIRNRLLAGYLICRTGQNSSPLYGAFPGPYFSAPGATAAAGRVVYPVRGGVLDTIQWEAVREGIDDVRYYGALKNYIRDLKDRQLRKDATTQADLHLTSLLKKSLWTLSPAEYQATRQGMISQSLKLLTIIRSRTPTYPG